MYHNIDLHCRCDRFYLPMRVLVRVISLLYKMQQQPQKISSNPRQQNWEKQQKVLTYSLKDQESWEFRLPIPSNKMADVNDEDLYDEFGNYIGPELDSSSDEESSVEEDHQAEAPDDASDVSGDDNAMVVVGEGDNEEDQSAVADPMNAIVLHEDKEHYLSAEQTFGEGVRTAVLDEDAMDLDTPIVEPVTTKTH